ncbi:ABC transporter ATP-binding protein [Leptospira ryugenii]|nr:ATP-binding cassette domain-containing protein [Leptospira ryugenii]
MVQEILLKNQSLTLNVGYKTLFRNREISLPKTGLVLVLGENGSGKSSLLKEIYSHAPYRKDWVWTDGPKAISYLGHDLGLYPALTLAENLRYFARQSPQSEQTILHWASYYGLRQRLPDPVSTFSRGMKQKAAILRTYFEGANLVLMDEPFTGLDTKATGLFCEHLKLWSESSCLLLVLHEVPKDLQSKERIQL